MKTLLKILFVVASFTILFSFVDIPTLLASFKHATPPLVTYFFLVSVALIYMSAIKWQLFLEELGGRVSALRLFGYYLVGYFVNLIVPSYVGGDAARSYLVGRQVGQHEAAAATICERYTGFFAMIILAVTFVWFIPQLPLHITVIVVGLACGLLIGTVIALSDSLLKVLEVIPLLNRLLPPFRKVQAGLRFASRQPKLVVHSMAISFLFHSFTVLNVLAAGWLVGWEQVPVAKLFVVLPLILLIGAVPITPGGVGLQEGAYFYFLGRLGATEEQALAIALALRAKAYVLAVFGGVIWLAVSGSRGEETGDEGRGRVTPRGTEKARSYTEELSVGDNS